MTKAPTGRQGFDDVDVSVVMARKGAQGTAGDGSDDARPFIVLLHRRDTALAVPKGQRERMAAHLQHIGQLLSIETNAAPNDLFETLDVEASTPKLLLYWKGALQSPVWLLDPAEPNLGDWITALQEWDSAVPV